MTTSELKKYIEFAAPDLDVVVLDRKTYDRLMQKAMTLNAIADKLRISSKLVDKAMKQIENGVALSGNPIFFVSLRQSPLGGPGAIM